MQNKTLLRTNALICTIIILGFFGTFVVGYQSNFDIFRQDIQRVSLLAEEGVYHQIGAVFSQPVSVSLTMANDQLLKGFLADEETRLDDPEYVLQLRRYLDAYRIRYGYDSVFLVSSATDRYYHFNGLNRVLSPGEAEDEWYYSFLGQQQELSLNIDNDQAAGNSITAFINCRITDERGETLGVVGVGLRVDQLQEILRTYGQQHQVTTLLVDDQGIIQLSPEATGDQGRSFFQEASFASFQDQVLGDKTGVQSFWYPAGGREGYLTARYVPMLQWHLLVLSDTSLLDATLRTQVLQSAAILLLILVAVLVTITGVIGRYNRRISDLTIGPELEYQRLLHEATVGLYDHIFEWNITRDRPEGRRTLDFLAGLGLAPDASYDDALAAIARHQIKPEYVQGYLDTFCRSHVLEVYASGLNSLSYDFVSRVEQAGAYQWIRLTCRIFYWASDQSVRMLSYRQSIEQEKQRELALMDQSRRDAMTGLYNKKASDELIQRTLQSGGVGACYALFLFDIDNFKLANDQYGHAFGDKVICTFSALLQSQFRDTDLVGRVGGDEFAVLMPAQSESAVRRKLDALYFQLHQVQLGEAGGYHLSISTGAALFPAQGATSDELYEKADQALYSAKAHGRDCYQIFGADAVGRAECALNPRDMEYLLDAATDGLSKVAMMGQGRFKLLYFNAHRVELTGATAAQFAAADFHLETQVHPEDQAPLLQALEAAQASQQSFRIHYRLRHADGHYIPVCLRGFFLSELYESRYPVFYAIFTLVR